MSDPLYREIILEHFKNPHNYGVVEKADIDVREYNPLCGDDIRITAKIKDKNIEKIAFVSSGCAISKASASIFTDMVKDKKIKEIKDMKPEELLEELGTELTPGRLKCALLAFSTLKKGLK